MRAGRKRRKDWRVTGDGREGHTTQEPELRVGIQATIQVKCFAGGGLGKEQGLVTEQQDGQCVWRGGIQEEEGGMRGSSQELQH